MLKYEEVSSMPHWIADHMQTPEIPPLLSSVTMAMKASVALEM